MTTRDRLVVMGIAALAVLAAAWLLVVAPERAQVSTLRAQVSSARGPLSTAESELSAARSAQAQYAKAYAEVVRLGKAVPPSAEVPSLVYELDQASNGKHVEFSSITTSGSGGTSASPAAAASGSSAAASAGFSALPFTLSFSGSYQDLYNLIAQLDSFTQRTASGGIEATGRLLTIQSIGLTPAQGTSTGSAKSAQGAITASITATAYVLPVSQGSTGGASPAATTGGAAQPASTGSGSSSSTSTPAVVKANP